MKAEKIYIKILFFYLLAIIIFEVSNIDFSNRRQNLIYYLVPLLITTASNIAKKSLPSRVN